MGGKLPNAARLRTLCSAGHGKDRNGPPKVSGGPLCAKSRVRALRTKPMPRRKPRFQRKGARCAKTQGKAKPGTPSCSLIVVQRRRTENHGHFLLLFFLASSRTLRPCVEKCEAHNGFGLGSARRRCAHIGRATCGRRAVVRKAAEDEHLRNGADGADDQREDKG